MRIDRLKIFLDSMGGGAWPFLVGGVICLVDSDNGRDLSVLVGFCQFAGTDPLRRTIVVLDGGSLRQ